MTTSPDKVPNKSTGVCPECGHVSTAHYAIGFDHDHRKPHDGVTGCELCDHWMISAAALDALLHR